MPVLAPALVEKGIDDENLEFCAAAKPFFSD
jgi:hypothetical protein